MFAGRVLAFDMGCTRAYAELLARVRKAGCGIGAADACIAAVALANGLVVATRDAAAFRAGGLMVINPWEEGWGQAWVGGTIYCGNYRNNIAQHTDCRIFKYFIY